MTSKNSIPKARQNIVTGVSAMLVHDSKVLLVLRKNNPFKNHWSLPGGRQNFGERLEDAVLREIKEETALEMKVAEFVTFYESISEENSGLPDYHTVIGIFKAFDFDGSLLAGDDALDAKWASLEDLNNLTLTPNTADLIRQHVGDLLK